MKTIAVMKHTKDILENFANEDENMDKTILRLLEQSNIPIQQDRTKTNINVDDSTLIQLKKYKAYPTESHSDTILRLLNELED